MELILSPWKDRFVEFAQSIDQCALFASPYITEKPLDILAEKAARNRSIEIKILTKLDTMSLATGSLDINAVRNFCSEFPQTTMVSHLSGLHAKVYVADQHTAIVTSGNLTHSSLLKNKEFGVRLDDRASVIEIKQNLLDYERFGSPLSLEQLSEFCEQSQRLSETYRSVLKSGGHEGSEQFFSLERKMQNSIHELKGQGEQTITSIFKSAVLHALQKSPMKTEEIHSQIKSIHPDLCDDSEDRIINGVYFGKKWKHHVRNAQQALKKVGKIELVDKKWRLVQ